MEIRSLLAFLKDPSYQVDPEPGWRHRIRSTALLLPWALGVGLVLALLLGIVDTLGPWELDEHMIDDLLSDYPASFIFLLATLAAPVFEELLFRGPLWFFRDSRFFKTAFWGFTLLFALVHLSNFPGLRQVWFLAPLLISPQFCLGIFLGFIRVRCGLLYAMLFHAAYNGILLGPVLLLYQVS
ncbi:MAG: CPBP family intramembrane metalloprotease [Robiginitalea sp.]